MKKYQSKSYHIYTTKCIEYKNKNTETNYNSIRISGLQRFNSSTKC